MNLNDNWIFYQKWSDGLRGSRADGGVPVRLPHTVREMPYHYFDERAYQMESAYQRQLQIPAEWKGKRLFLTFEGAAHRAQVFLNGIGVAEHFCGYTAFTADISDTVRFGEENLLSVRLDSRESLNQPPFGGEIDFLTYGGLYRDVYLEVKDPVCMESVFYQPTLRDTPKTRGMSLDRLKQVTMTGNVQTSIVLSKEAYKRAQQRRLFVCQFLDNKQISNQPLSPDGQTATLAGKVHLWDIASPVCYEIRTELRLDGETVDAHTDRIGFRHIQWKAKGFFLNGRQLKLRGICRHQSFPYVGDAMPESMQREDARIIRHELGCNAVRTADCPPSRHFLDGCDDQGLLVFAEIPGQTFIGDDKWKQIACQNTREMIGQHRNHPSVILWGVRIADSKDDDELYAETNRIAREMDPSRPTAGARDEAQTHLLEDVYTYDDYSHDGSNEVLEEKSEVTPDTGKPYLVSAYVGCSFPTKSYDNEARRTEQMLRHAAVLNAIADDGGIAGGFGWCMSDYFVHSGFGSGDGLCYQGIMDAFRNPKMAAQLYAAQAGQSNVLYVSSDMQTGEHSPDAFGETYLIASAPTVRMYRDGRLLKEYTTKDSPYPKMRSGPVLVDDYLGDVLTKKEGYAGRQAKLLAFCLNQRAMYGQAASGKVKLALAQLVGMYRMREDQIDSLYQKYIGTPRSGRSVFRFEALRDGKVVAELKKEPVSGMHLEVKCSHMKLVERDSYDVASVRVRAVDDAGNVLCYYDESMRLEAAGAVILIGPEVVPLRGGQSGFYVKSTGESGKGAVRIRVPGMEACVVQFEADCGQA
mgnify:CR=1 FL=1